MGDIISIGDSLIITAFSMVVVFILLIIISIFISVLKNIGVEKKQEITKVAAPTINKVVEVKDPVINNQNDEELVAVISAAIAASMGVKIPEINIKSIRRIPQSIPTWGVAGRQEQVYSKL